MVVPIVMSGTPAQSIDIDEESTTSEESNRYAGNIVQFSNLAVQESDLSDDTFMREVDEEDENDADVESTVYVTDIASQARRGRSHREKKKPAARKRNRQQDIIADLRGKIDELKSSLNIKYRDNAVLKAQNELLESQNLQLSSLLHRESHQPDMLASNSNILIQLHSALSQLYNEEQYQQQRQASQPQHGTHSEHSLRDLVPSQLIHSLPIHYHQPHLQQQHEPQQQHQGQSHQGSTMPRQTEAAPMNASNSNIPLDQQLSLDDIATLLNNPLVASLLMQGSDISMQKSDQNM